MHTKIKAYQLFCILFTSRLLGTFTYMVRLNSDLNTGARIAMLLAFLFISLLMSVPVFMILNGQNNTSFLQQLTPFSSKTRSLIACLYCAVFLLSAIITLTRFGLFTGTVLLQNTSLHIFILSLMIVSIYAAHKGLQPLARSSVLFTFILVLSLFFVQIGVCEEFDFLNISCIKASRISDILKQAVFSACRNIEIPAVLFIADRVNGKINKTLFCMLAGFSAVTSILFFVAGGVTGAYGEQQMFPLFTLSSVSKLGFIERMEDILTGIWVACAMIKIAFLLIVASVCLQETRKKDCGIPAIITLGGIVFAGYLLLSCDITGTIKLLQSPLLPVGFIFFGVLLPFYLHLIAKKKQQKIYKENHA